MKRTKKISFDGEYGKATITINVDSKWLSRGETDIITNRLTDDAMRMLTNAPMIQASLSKIKVY